VSHPDRRADVRRVHQHHHDAGRPQGVGHALSGEPGHGRGRDLRDLRRARHRDGGAVDGAAHDAGVLPVIVHLGFDPVWLGIIIWCVVETGLITPPVGINLFVLKTLLPHVPTGTVFRGVMPFMWADVIRLALLVAFPAISLWLPRMMR